MSEHDHDHADRLERFLSTDADPPPGIPGLTPSGEPPEETAPDADAGRDADQDASPQEQEQEPGDGLPDAPIFALLRTVQRDVGVDRIDRIWLFPPRRLEAGETSVVVVAAFAELDQDRRRVYAAHYTAHADSPEPRLVLAEYGTAPAERVGRLVEEVVERLKEEPATPPRTVRIEGDEQRWNEMLHELAEKHLEEAVRDPRRRPAGGR